MAGLEGWRGIVLDRELDGLGDFRAGELRDDAEGEVDSRGDAAAREDVAVAHHPPVSVTGADEGQQVDERPVRGRAAPGPGT